MNSMPWHKQAAALWKKDIRAEMRTRVATGSMGVFALSALLLIALSMLSVKGVEYRDALGRLKPAWDDAGKMALLWTLLCFAAFTGLAHPFVHEEESGTSLALRLYMSAEAVYAGKLLFNLTTLAAMMLVITPAYMLLTGMNTGRLILFFPIMIGGCFGLGSVATVVAALAAKAKSSGALFGAIGLPILVVFLILLMQAAHLCYAGNATPISIVKDVGGLVSFGVMIVALSAMLFHFIWDD